MDARASELHLRFAARLAVAAIDAQARELRHVQTIVPELAEARRALAESLADGAA